MSSPLSLILFGAVSLGVLYAFLTMPAWCFQSVHRHAIWKVRDNLVDDVISGALPDGHPATEEIVWRANLAVSDRRPRHITDVWSWAIARRGQERALGARSGTPLDGDMGDVPNLTDDQRSKLIGYRDELDFLVTSSLLLGSWWGFLYVLGFAVPELLRRLARWFVVGRAKSHGTQLGGVASQAMHAGAERAISGPRFGRLIPQHAGQLYVSE